MKRQVNACRLLTPGPVSIEASVLEAMTCCPSPADAAFISMMEDVRSRLLRVAGMRPAEYAAVLMAGPCAFALEAALTTLIPEESRVLVVCNGARAEAACRMLARADIAFEKLETGFEQAAGAAEIAMLLDERPDITHVAVVHVDAVSGLRNDLGEIGRAVRAEGRTFIVDAGVSFGATSIDAEALGIDVLLSVADCGLKGVSGLSFVLARRNILESSEGRARSVSLDLFEGLRRQEAGILGGGTEEMSRGAEPLGGGAARRRRRSGCGCMTPFPVRNTGCPCGSVRCRPCRSKGTRHAQSHQHNSATVRGKGAVDTTVKPMKSFSETSMFMALASLGCFRPGRNRMRCDEKAPPAGWREGRESGGAAPGTT